MAAALAHRDTRKRRARNSAHYQEQVTKRARRTAQYLEAEAWCKATGRKASACLKANPHLDLVTKTSLTSRLDGKVITGEE